MNYSATALCGNGRGRKTQLKLTLTLVRTLSHTHLRTYTHIHKLITVPDISRTEWEYTGPNIYTILLPPGPVDPNILYVICVHNIEHLFW